MDPHLRLLFVRHAESTANAAGRIQGHADYPLSDAGRAQAEKLYQRLQHEGLAPTHVYTSPLRRASETAEILASDWTMPVTPWDDLKEYDVGLLAGLTREEAERALPDVDLDAEWARQLSGVKGAESLPERGDRGRRVADALLQRHRQGDVVVVVSHGGTIQYIIAALLGTDRIWGWSTENTAVFDFTVDLDRRQLSDETLMNTAVCRINRFNDASHLTLNPQP